MLPVTELASWFPVSPILQDLLIGARHHHTATDAVGLRLPVYAYSSIQRTKGPWPAVHKWPGDTYDSYSSEAAKQATTVGTYCPWFLILNLRQEPWQLPLCSHGTKCMQVMAIGDGWLVYEVNCHYRDCDGLYRKVLVRF
ncbi:hypothetical protein BDZ91DRAFT_738554, partial [Kalaharituber pfeilii]